MSFGIAYGCVYASRLLHTDLLSKILRAPMAFFDTTPLGKFITEIKLCFGGRYNFQQFLSSGNFFYWKSTIAANEANNNTYCLKNRIESFAQIWPVLIAV